MLLCRDFAKKKTHRCPKKKIDKYSLISKKKKET